MEDRLYYGGHGLIYDVKSIDFNKLRSFIEILENTQSLQILETILETTKSGNIATRDIVLELIDCDNKTFYKTISRLLKLNILVVSEMKLHESYKINEGLLTFTIDQLKLIFPSEKSTG